MKKLLLLTLLIVGCVFAREYIAIIDFEGTGVTKDETKALTQRLTSEMIALEVYQVVERSEMKQLLDEQKFQYSGCTDTECAIEIGKILNSNYIVIGSVSKLGSTYSIDSRMIDIETSEVISSASYSHKGDIDKLLNKGIIKVAKQIYLMNEIPQNLMIHTNQGPIYHLLSKLQ